MTCNGLTEQTVNFLPLITENWEDVITDMKKGKGHWRNKFCSTEEGMGFNAVKKIQFMNRENMLIDNQ